MATLKQLVRRYWDNSPCGSTLETSFKQGTKEYFEAHQRWRYNLEPFIHDYARFARCRGKKVLEIGCGMGADLLQFAKAEAVVFGMDLSPQSAALTSQRLKVYECPGSVLIGDSENLPFPDNSLDLVYSWGVLHHTPRTEQAIAEVHRVLKPEGRICIMLYHKLSIVVLRLYLRFGLFALKPFRNIDKIIAEHVESPGTKAYTRPQIREIFKPFADLDIDTVITPYDIGIGRRNKLIPIHFRRFIPKALGWFIVIRGKKCVE